MATEHAWMNLEPVIKSEVRKRKTILYINPYIHVYIYIWNLEK